MKTVRGQSLLQWTGKEHPDCSLLLGAERALRDVLSRCHIILDEDVRWEEGEGSGRRSENDGKQEIPSRFLSFTHLFSIEMGIISVHLQLLRGCWIIYKLPQEEPAERGRSAGGCGSHVSAALCWTTAGKQLNLWPNFKKTETSFQPTKQNNQTETNLTRDQIKNSPNQQSLEAL